MRRNIVKDWRGGLGYGIGAALLGMMVVATPACLDPGRSSDGAGDPDGTSATDTLPTLDTYRPDSYVPPPDTLGQGPTDCYFGWDTAGQPLTGTVAIDVVALTPPGPPRQVVWDVEVTSAGGGVVAQRRVSATSSEDDAPAIVHTEMFCDPTPGSDWNTVTLYPVGVYQLSVAPQDLGAFGAAAPPDGDTPLLADATTATFVCQSPYGASVRLVTAPMLGVGYAEPGPHGIYDLGAVFAGVACHAEMQCCQDSDHDGTCDSELSWYPPIDGAEWSVIRWRFMCFALSAPQSPPADPRPTDLFLDDVVLDCGGAGRVAIDPTARRDDPYCAQPGMSGAPSGCVGLDGAESGLVKQVDVYAPGSSPPYLTATMSMRIGVDKPALAGHDCTLRARATGVRGASALALTGLGEPSAAGTFAFGPNVAYPVLTWDVALSRDGAFICGEHSLVTTPQVGIRAATPDEPAFPHHTTLEP